jgi:hypothetical protein
MEACDKNCTDASADTSASSEAQAMRSLPYFDKWSRLCANDSNLFAKVLEEICMLFYYLSFMRLRNCRCKR